MRRVIVHHKMLEHSRNGLTVPFVSHLFCNPTAREQWDYSQQVPIRTCSSMISVWFGACLLGNYVGNLQGDCTSYHLKDQKGQASECKQVRPCESTTR